MPPRLDGSAFCQLLSRPNAIEAFNHRVTHILNTLRIVDEGIPRTERQIIRSFKSWKQKQPDTELRSFKQGDSSVIVPLVELNNEPWIIFTHRSYKLRNHRGEISFPGGRIDEGESIEQAAIREAEEEIGLKATDIQVWGRLPAMLTRFNRNIITPVVGKVDESALGRLQISTDEVQSIFMAPLDELVDAKYTAFRVGHDLYKMPAYFTKQYQVLAREKDAYENPDNVYRIWGLTGGILNEVLASILPDEHYKYLT